MMYRVGRGGQGAEEWRMKDAGGHKSEAFWATVEWPVCGNAAQLFGLSCCQGGNSRFDSNFLDVHTIHSGLHRLTPHGPHPQASDGREQHGRLLISTSTLQNRFTLTVTPPLPLKTSDISTLHVLHLRDSFQCCLGEVHKANWERSPRPPTRLGD